MMTIMTLISHTNFVLTRSMLSFDLVIDSTVELKTPVSPCPCRLLHAAVS